jgi:hypothetical protein
VAGKSPRPATRDRPRRNRSPGAWTRALGQPTATLTKPRPMSFRATCEAGRNEEAGGANTCPQADRQAGHRRSRRSRSRIRTRAPEPRLGAWPLWTRRSTRWPMRLEPIWPCGCGTAGPRWRENATNKNRPAGEAGRACFARAAVLGTDPGCVPQSADKRAPPERLVSGRWRDAGEGGRLCERARDGSSTLASNI